MEGYSKLIQTLPQCISYGKCLLEYRRAGDVCVALAPATGGAYLIVPLAGCV